MALDRLSLYNQALIEIGEGALPDLTTPSTALETLDEVWDGGQIRDYWLEHGLWNFAMRASELTYSPSITPAFGYKYAFDKPTDWIRTDRVCQDEYFSTIVGYEDEADYWYTDLEAIYVRYVSNDDAYGYDWSRWPAKFSRWVVVYMASRICERITQNRRKALDLKAEADPAFQRPRSGPPPLLTAAQSSDAMNESPQQIQRGHWVRSRVRYGSHYNGRPGRYY